MAFRINALASAPYTAMLRNSSNAFRYSEISEGLGDLNPCGQQLHRHKSVVVDVEQLLRPEDAPPRRAGDDPQRHSRKAPAVSR